MKTKCKDCGQLVNIKEAQYLGYCPECPEPESYPRTIKRIKEHLEFDKKMRWKFYRKKYDNDFVVTDSYHSTLEAYDKQIKKLEQELVLKIKNTCKTVWIRLDGMEYLVTEETARRHKLGHDVDFCGGAEDEAHYQNYAPPKKYILEEREVEGYEEDSYEFDCPAWNECE